MTPSRRSSLAKALRTFEDDGIAGLERFAEAQPPDRGLLDELVAGLAVPSDSVAASWLLKAYLERGASLDAGQTAAVCRSLDRVRDKDARLHCCQAVKDLEIPARNAEQLARFVRACQESDYKFLRAWACDALHRLAIQHAKYRDEAALALHRASRDSAASVRARARNLEKELRRDIGSRRER